MKHIFQTSQQIKCATEQKLFMANEVYEGDIMLVKLN